MLANECIRINPSTTPPRPVCVCQDDSIDGIEVSTYRGRLQVCLKVWGYRKVRGLRFGGHALGAHSTPHNALHTVHHGECARPTRVRGVNCVCECSFGRAALSRSIRQ